MCAVVLNTGCLTKRVWLWQIRRPNNYDPTFALFLGPAEPDPTMNLESLDIVKTIVQDSPNKLFLGGLPCDWTEDQVRVHLETPESPRGHRATPLAV